MNSLRTLVLALGGFFLTWRSLKVGMSGIQEKEWIIGIAWIMSLVGSVGFLWLHHTRFQLPLRRILFFFLGFIGLWVAFLVTGNPLSPAHDFLFEVLEMVWTAGILLPIFWLRREGENPAGTRLF